MTTISMDIEFDIPEPDDPRYEGTMCFEVEVEASEGVAPWKGSCYSCPTSGDWNGEPAEFEGWESVVVYDCTLSDGKGDYREPNPDELARLDKYVGGEGKSWFEQEIENQVASACEDEMISAAEARADW